MSIDVVESRIAALQNRIAALSGGQVGSSTGSTPSDAATALSFSDVLGAQNADLGAMLDQVGGGDLTSTNGTSTGSSLSDQLGSVLGGVDGTVTGTTSTTGPTGTDVVADAEKYLGVPYKWGGTNPATGLDCSGLVQQVMKDVGVTMPRTVAQQRNVGQEVDSMKDAKPGDLLVFGSHHIGIYVGDGKMLHAPHTGDHVRISDVYETPTRIRRVLPSGTNSTDSIDGSGADLSALASLRPAALRQNASGVAGGAASQFNALFASATQKYDLPTGLLKAVASVESSYNPNAVSPAGAQGLMQLMPGTAKGLGVDAMNPTQAVDGAGRMLAGLVKEFGSVKLALAAYNAGAGAVKKYGGVPPYAETQSYVRKVMSRMES